MLFCPNIPEGLIKDYSLSTPCLHVKIDATDQGIKRSFDGALKLTTKYSEAFLKRNRVFLSFPFAK